MDENSAEAMGLTAFVAMSHLLTELDRRDPGLKSAVIESAEADMEAHNGAGNSVIIKNNLLKL
jgi:hypothetical protein